MDTLIEKIDAASKLTIRADERKEQSRAAGSDATIAGNNARDAWDAVADHIVEIVRNDSYAKDSKLGKMVNHLSP